ncbi:actin-related protein ArpC2 [Volvox carteri f. nagariensis]|uniref:Arp2/3 complex 34 kDa subunit n=1 Tax=Volvox carteri f. nagariensis TaxID=3068 RepID=D8UI69_VOLCA|nr:actin-related protein ArpC2 [Volvox carteri f. nagariensis]EFJ40594.1 actin-related protein ArpC2 [Volvox carteri f. nagariensis]|eukprot:XP_002958372.1 actin-related protein ArpC2 [Volvox carteri f. nagariensis]
MASQGSGTMISCQNRIIQNRIIQLIQQKAAGIEPKVLGPQVVEEVAAAFRGIATASEPSTQETHEKHDAPQTAPANPQPAPPGGRYHVALDIDLPLLARLSAAQQDSWSRSLASLRLLMVGHPLRQVFRALEAGSLAPGPPLVCCNTPGQVFVIKPASESVALTFPLRFSGRQDTAIGVAFLQEFVEARRGPSLGRAPTCSYQLKEPPGELAGLDLSGMGVGGPGGGGCNGGYLTLTLTRRHVSGPQMEAVVWILATLPHFVSSHVKATKAMLRSRMRRRVMSMIELLGAGGGGAGPAAGLVT